MGNRFAEIAKPISRFESVLYPSGSRMGVSAREPAFFRDLHLDRIVDAITAGRQDYDLKQFFYAPLQDEDSVEFRQEVMRDLEQQDLRGAVHEFAENMARVRRYVALSQRIEDPNQNGRWFLDAAGTWCEALKALAGALSQIRVSSRGLRLLREYLTTYLGSPDHLDFSTETKRLASEMQSIRYVLFIHGLRVEARPALDEPDYGGAVKEAFSRLQTGRAESYPFQLLEYSQVNSVEAAILELLRRMHPELFSAIANFRESRAGFIDPVIARFDREIQFYVSWTDYIARFQTGGLPFCYPRMRRESREVSACDAFDLALAEKLIGNGSIPVLNDFCLKSGERIIVVTGPNQGGKSTFARMFGQMHYFGSLGLPVPGSRAILFLADGIFVHFEREEHVADLRGKLQDDLLRMHAILRQVTANSIVIINEIFVSTTFRDARNLSTRIVSKLLELDLLCVWVTFIDELACFHRNIVSMVSTVRPEDPRIRTFKVMRRQADGIAYALSIAEKYHLTQRQLKERFRR